MISLTMAEVKDLVNKYNGNQGLQGPIIEFDSQYGFIGTGNVNEGTRWSGWRLYGDFGLEHYRKLQALAREMGLHQLWDQTIFTSTTALLLVTEKVTLEWNELGGTKLEKEVYVGEMKLIKKPGVDFNGSYSLNLKVDKSDSMEGDLFLEDWLNAFESDANGIFKDRTGKPVKIKL